MSLSGSDKKKYLIPGQTSEMPGRRKRTIVVDDIDDALEDARETLESLCRKDGARVYLSVSVRYDYEEPDA